MGMHILHSFYLFSGNKAKKVFTKVGRAKYQKPKIILE